MMAGWFTTDSVRLLRRDHPTARTVTADDNHGPVRFNVVAVATTTPSTTVPSGPPPGPPPSSSVNCIDFPNWAAANAWLEYYFPIYGDIAGLDAQP
jgi:hypothetical protein